MIGTIRKHSSWLWFVIIGATIISFLWWGAGPVTRNSGGRTSGSGYGSLYGKEVTPEAFAAAPREFFIYYYWLHYGEWPDRSVNMTHDEMEKETYVRLLLAQKAKSLGVYVGDDAVVAGANELLRSVGGRSGQPVPMATFLERVLTPEGLTAADLQRYLRNDLAIQQLVQTLGLSGALITPTEATQLYNRDHQEVSAQAVFFAASNYLAQVSVTPAAVGQFYTNNMAAYRQPDRVAVNYVVFAVTNYLAQSKAEWAKTNFEEYVDAYYRQNASQYADAKTPEEAKVKVRELLVHNRALMDARQQANDFANPLFAIDPAKAENLVSAAKAKGLTVHTTMPFAANDGPQEFDAPPTFTKDAFKLSGDEPFAGPIVGTDGVYVMALAQQLPSAIPALDEIHSRVVADFQEQQAIALARNAGTNFYFNAMVSMAAGKTFAQVAIASGQTPQVLPAFSLSSSEVPGFDGRAELGALKQAAFTTPAGHVSSFTGSADGGFVLFVQSMLPLDEAKKTAEFPQFLTQVRRGRQNEAFNLWLQGEANRELRNTPIYQQMAAGAAK
jgi:hypothetical protein